MKLSIIVPTCGRQTLIRTINSVKDQLEEGDTVNLVSDGPSELAWYLSTQTEGVRYYQHRTPAEREIRVGHDQRNYALWHGLARGDYLLWIGDDDVYEPGALAVIREALTVNPGRPHLFRMRAHWGRLVWQEPRLVKEGNVSDQIFVCPNISSKLARFNPARYEGDFDFIRDTCLLQGGPVWHDAVIVTCRPGEGAIENP